MENWQMREDEMSEGMEMDQPRAGASKRGRRKNTQKASGARGRTKAKNRTKKGQ